jgi:hypothetical protein
MSDTTPKVKFGGDYSTAQIYRMGYEFAFMARKSAKHKTYEQATPFVYCKDFLHDALWALINKQAWEIYGFKYDPKKNIPLELDQTVMAFRNSQFKGDAKKFHAMLEPCLEFLHKCEELLEFQPTEIYKVDQAKSPCWLLISDPGWQHAPTMISLYTLFIRVGCFHKLGDSVEQTLGRAEKGSIKIGDDTGYAGNRDGSYIKQGRKGIDLILKHGLEIWHPKQEDNYPPKLKEAGLHNNFGIVNFTAQRPKTSVPHWYRKEIWG